MRSPNAATWGAFTWTATAAVGSAIFLHDGDSEIAEYDNTGALIRRFVPGAAIDDMAAMVTASSVRTYPMTDRQGSVIAMSGTSAALAEGPYTYDPYGNCFSGSSPCSTGEPYRFTGQRFDAETGLLYYRARYYSPFLGRFMQTDPVGYEADLNLYTYVGNDPINKFDPLGLDSWLVARPVYYFGIHVGDHTFVVVSDKPGGEPKAQFHYGPQNKESPFNPGHLVSLTGTNTTTRDDNKAWNSLGTPDHPGNVPYSRLPTGEEPGANSNSAASSVANNAVQHDHPGAPPLPPPPGSNTPGSNVSISTGGCVSGPGGASCDIGHN